MVYFSNGPQGGEGTVPDNYQRFSQDANFNLSDNLSHQFGRIIGQQYISLVNNTVNARQRISFGITGGSNTLTNGYTVNYPNIANYYINGETPINCTITPVNSTGTTLLLNVFNVVSSIDGNTYQFSFSPFAAVKPTIRFISGMNPVTSLVLEVEYFRWLLA